jgi:hypothetical protein
MERDVLEQVEPYLSDDPAKLGKLASETQKEILIELRKLNGKEPAKKDA